MEPRAEECLVFAYVEEAKEALVASYLVEAVAETVFVRAMLESRVEMALEASPFREVEAH